MLQVAKLGLLLQKKLNIFTLPLCTLLINLQRNVIYLFNLVGIQTLCNTW